MNEIWKELIKEASTGKIIIDQEEWPIAFNTIIQEDGKVKEEYRGDYNFSTLIIKEEEIFSKLLEEYIQLELEKNRKTVPFFKEIEKNKIKWLMAYLLVNATTEDFENIEDYIRRRIHFLKDNTFEYLKEGIQIETGNTLLNSKLRIQKIETSTSMETPNRIEMSLMKESNEEILEYELPNIYYGIEGDTCYIYSMQTKKKKRDSSLAEEKYQKQINILLYKLNQGTEEERDYEEESIMDVTHSFVFALNIFTSILMKEEKIKKIKVVSYLPVRYASRFNTANHYEEEKKEQLLNRNDTIQENLTNKLIRTMRRVAYHDKRLKIESYPYEQDEFLTIKLQKEKEKEINNMILEETTNKLESLIEEKERKNYG